MLSGVVHTELFTEDTPVLWDPVVNVLVTQSAVLF